MSGELLMRQADMREPPEKSAYVWQLPVLQATNLVTGIATLYGFHSIGCHHSRRSRSRCLERFQEIDITGVTMPITKHNYIVKDITKLADTIREAFRIAQEGQTRSCSG